MTTTTNHTVPESVYVDAVENATTVAELHDIVNARFTRSETPTFVVTLPAATVARIFANALLVASDDRMRPAIYAVHATIGDATLTVTATDSYALLEQSATIVGHHVDGTVTMPREFVADMVRIAKVKNAGPITIVSDGSAVHASTDTASISGILADEFPATASLWPTERDVPAPIESNAYARFSAQVVYSRLAKIKGPGRGDDAYLAWSQSVGAFATTAQNGKPCVWSAQDAETRYRFLAMPIR